MRYNVEVALEALERARASALQDAAEYADGGNETESVYQDGIAQGLAQAMDIVRNSQNPGGYIII